MEINHSAGADGACMARLLRHESIMAVEMGKQVPMRCGEVMRRDVIVVTPETTVLAAAQRMRESNLGFLPVCANDGMLVGVLTDRDIVLRVCAAGLDLEGTLVADVMTQGPITCRARGSLEIAERIMRTKRKARLPVVDRRGHLVGVLSLSDVAQYESPRRTGQILFDVSQRKYDPRTS
jgi:CBS domain-containing protein